MAPPDGLALPVTQTEVAPGRSSSADRLCRTIATVFEIAPDEVTDESSPDTIATWDSLNHLNLVMAIEDEFGVSLSAQDTIDMRNVGLIRTILGDHGVRI